MAIAVTDAVAATVMVAAPAPIAIGIAVVVCMGGVAVRIGVWIVV